MSCTNTTDITKIDQAAVLNKNFPDSAYILLQEIKYPQQLSEEYQAFYGLVMSECQLKMGKRILSDSLIAHSVAYYRTINDSVNDLKVSMFAGQINLYILEYEKAMGYFFYAEKLALRSMDSLSLYSINRSIGLIYRHKENWEKSREYHLKSLNYLSENERGYWIIYWDLGYTSRMLKDYDESLSWFKKILELPDDIIERSIISSVCNQISQIYVEKEDYKNALKYAEDAQNNRAIRDEASVYNLAKGELFLKIQQLDSARIYLTRAISSPELLVSTNAYHALINLENAMGKYKEAYFAVLNQESSFLNIVRTIESEIWEQQFLDEKIKNENTTLRLEKRNREVYLLISGCVFMILFILVFIYYNNDKKKKIKVQHIREEEELKSKALLLESQNLILKQEHELSLLREKASSLRAAIFRKMSLSNKIPSLDRAEKNINLPENKRITLTEQEWNELIKTVNDAYMGFADKLLKQFPDLSSDDIAFCCLLKINVSMRDLSDIYCISKAGITKKKFRMKKEKLKLLYENQTLDEFLQEY